MLPNRLLTNPPAAKPPLPNPPYAKNPSSNGNFPSPPYTQSHCSMLLAPPSKLKSHTPPYTQSDFPNPVVVVVVVVLDGKLMVDLVGSWLLIRPTNVPPYAKSHCCIEPAEAHLPNQPAAP